MAFVPSEIPVTLFKNTTFFFTLKSDKGPDPHWFYSLDPDPHSDKKRDQDHPGSGYALKPM
jgi:hypothetical protein